MLPVFSDSMEIMLALESDYRSYNTFREAFKRKTGQSVTVWMKAVADL